MAKNLRFAKWVRAYGVARLARTLGVTRTAVQHWITKDPRRMPSRTNSRRIVSLSTVDPREIGPLELEDIG